jgi:hypothetical protein
LGLTACSEKVIIKITRLLHFPFARSQSSTIFSCAQKYDFARQLALHLFIRRSRNATPEFFICVT